MDKTLNWLMGTDWLTDKTKCEWYEYGFDNGSHYITSLFALVLY